MNIILGNPKIVKIWLIVSRSHSCVNIIVNTPLPRFPTGTLRLYPLFIEVLWERFHTSVGPLASVNFHETSSATDRDQVAYSCFRKSWVKDSSFQKRVCQFFFKFDSACLLHFWFSEPCPRCYPGSRGPHVQTMYVVSLLFISLCVLMIAVWLIAILYAQPSSVKGGSELKMVGSHISS